MRNLSRGRAFVGAICGAIFLAWQSALAQTGDESQERFERLERAVQLLEARNAELEAKVKRLEAREPVASSQSAEAPLAPRSAPGKTVAAPDASEREPVVVTASASEFRLTLGGFIQTQVEIGDVSAFEGRFPLGPTNVLGASEVPDRFRVRRSRINVSGDYAEQFEFKLEGEFQLTASSGFTRTSFAATDLFVNWHAYPQLNIKVGQFKAPFGLEQLTSDSRLLSIESSLATTALAPDRQIGVQVWGHPFAHLGPERGEWLTYYAGMFNGVGRNLSVNDNSEFMYVGRLEVTALRSKMLNQETQLRFGASGLTSRDNPGFTISNALFVNEDGSLAPFAYPTAGGRKAFGFDTGLSIGPFELIAEYLDQRVYSREVAGFPVRWRNFRADGYYVQGSYDIIPDKLQLVTKWESFDPGQTRNDDVHSITAGLNYYIRGHDLKLMANYIHTWSDFRENNPQYGRAEFDQVILRLQVMF